MMDDSLTKETKLLIYLFIYLLFWIHISADQNIHISFNLLNVSSNARF